MIEHVIQQDITKISNRYPKEPVGSSHFHTKPNNWLKMHGITMRRKPHKKKVVILDEFWMISGPNEPSPLIKSMASQVRKYQV